MSSARGDILARVREHRPAIDAPLPAVEDFAQGHDRLAEFTRRLLQMGGTVLPAGPVEDPLRPAREMIAAAGVVVSMLPELPGSRALDRAASAAPAALHDVDLGVVRARFAVAETGSVALRGEDLGVQALGYLAQRLLVLLDPADIVENLHHACARPEWGETGYLVLQTGPSATADIEGVLIHGAQGVRALAVLLVPRP